MAPTKPPDPNPHRNFVYPPARAVTVSLEVYDERQQNKRLLGFGVPSIDARVVPPVPGDLVVIEGRPGMGKTLNLIYLAKQASTALTAQGANPKEIVLYITWETRVEEFVGLASAGISGFSLSDIGRGKADLGKVKQAAVQLLNDRIYVIGRSKYNINDGDINLLDVEKIIQELIADGFTIAAAFVDYLQEIPPLQHVRTLSESSKVLYVSENLRYCKRLAMVYGIRMYVAVQARREVDEQDGLQFPTLNDGQWCVTGDTLIEDTVSGVIKSVKEWYDLEDLPAVFTLNNLENLVPVLPSRLIQSGVQPILKLMAHGGRELRASPNHPLLTPQGWVRLDKLKVGDYVASINRLPKHSVPLNLSEDRALLLGLLLGNGSYTNNHTPFYNAGHDPEIGEKVMEIATKEFGTTSTIKWNEPGSHYFLYMSGVSAERESNQLINYLRKIGMYGQLHIDATVPEVVMRANLPAVKQFLSGLFTTDGSVYRKKGSNLITITYSTTSKILARQVQLLLLRCRIVTSFGTAKPGKRSIRPCYNVQIRDKLTVESFFSEIGLVEGKKARKAKSLWLSVKENQKDYARSAHRVPPSIALRVIEKVKEHHLRDRFQMVKGRGMSIAHIKQVREYIDDSELDRLIGSEIHWVKVRSIESDGEEMTYDLSTPPYRNFVANDFIVHNTSAIEQVADKVFSLTIPSKYLKVGSTVENVNGKNYKVEEFTLCLRMLKQRWGVANTTDLWMLHFDPVMLDLVEQPSTGIYVEERDDPGF